MIVDMFAKRRTARHDYGTFAYGQGLHDRAGTAVQDQAFGAPDLAFELTRLDKVVSDAAWRLEWRMAALHDHRLRQGGGKFADGSKQALKRQAQVADGDERAHSSGPPSRPRR